MPFGTMPGRFQPYHKVTAWAWLLGPFVDAYLNAFGESEENVTYSLFERFRRHLAEAMLGLISEIFRGRGPARPKRLCSASVERRGGFAILPEVGSHR